MPFLIPVFGWIVEIHQFGTSEGMSSIRCIISYAA